MLVRGMKYGTIGCAGFVGGTAILAGICCYVVFVLGGVALVEAARKSPLLRSVGMFPA